ncbi:MAG: hypothetical protein ACXIUV_11050 [Alkalilacustris sp.]
MRPAILAMILALPLATPAQAEIRLSGDARMALTAERGDDRDTRTDRIASTRLRIDIERETQNGLRVGVGFGLSDGRLPDRGPRRD